MEYDNTQEDKKGFETAKIMRDDFQQLVETIKNAGNNYAPT